MNFKTPPGFTALRVPEGTGNANVGGAQYIPSEPDEDGHRYVLSNVPEHIEVLKSVHFGYVDPLEEAAKLAEAQVQKSIQKPLNDAERVASAMVGVEEMFSGLTEAQREEVLAKLQSFKNSEAPAETLDSQGGVQATDVAPVVPTSSSESDNGLQPPSNPVDAALASDPALKGIPERSAHAQDEPQWSRLSNDQLRKWLSDRNIPVAAGINKNGLIDICKEMWADPNVQR